MEINNVFADLMDFLKSKSIQIDWKSIPTKSANDCNLVYYIIYDLISIYMFDWQENIKSDFATNFSKNGFWISFLGGFF